MVTDADTFVYGQIQAHTHNPPLGSLCNNHLANKDDLIGHTRLHRAWDSALEALNCYSHTNNSLHSDMEDIDYQQWKTWVDDDQHYTIHNVLQWRYGSGCKTQHMVLNLTLNLLKWSFNLLAPDLFYSTYGYIHTCMCTTFYVRITDWKYYMYIQSLRQGHAKQLCLKKAVQENLP